jgi:hypothetical protein
MMTKIWQIIQSFRKGLIFNERGQSRQQSLGIVVWPILPVALNFGILWFIVMGKYIIMPLNVLQ